MNGQSVDNHSLRRFYITQVLWNTMLFAPTWVIFLQESHGLSLTQVTVIDLAFWLTMALLEIPTGVVADTLGRKYSMLIGIGLGAFSATLYGLAPNFLLLVIANSLWGAAFTFLSGADIAFFYDTILGQGGVDQYAQLRGRLAALTLAGGAVGNFAGGALANWSLASPFWIYGILLAVALWVGLGMKEPTRQVHPETGKHPAYGEILRMTFQAIRAQKRLRLSLLYSNALPLASMLVGIIFIQPHLKAIGLPYIWMGGVLFAFSLVRIGASNSAGWVARLGGKWLWAAPWLVMGGLLGIALIPNLLGVAAFSVAVFASVASRPMLEELILQDAPAASRATILSVDNMISRLFLFVLEPAGGVVADAFGLPTLFVAMAGGVWLAAMIILLLWRPERFARPAAEAKADYANP